jgi:DNA-binding transcriptional MerR regulator
MKHELNQMMTNGKMARLLGIDPKTLRKWARKGVVRSYINRVNGYRYYFKAEVMEDLKKVPGSKKLPVDQRSGKR